MNDPQQMHGFDWIVPEILAAMARPYDPATAMDFLTDEGVGTIVTLTENSLDETVVEGYGFTYHHLPIPDFAHPTAKQINKFITIVEKSRKAGKGCVVHCLAGRGRTGTMIACYLVFMGRAARAAIDEVRMLRPGSIETLEQEAAIERYARRLQS